MSRTLTAFHPVGPDTTGAVERFLADPVVWLPDGARHSGPGCWRIDLYVGRLSRPVLCEIDDPWRSGDTHWRRVRWLPLTEDRDLVRMDRVLPVLDAELGLTLDPKRGASLVVTGTYDVPAAFVGEAADALGLYRVARRTAVAFLAEVATGLTAASAEPGQPDAGTDQRRRVPPEAAGPITSSPPS